MKSRGSLFLFIAVLATLIALGWWRSQKKTVEIPPTEDIKAYASPPAAMMPSTVPAHTNLLATNSAQTSPQSKWEQMQPILASQNDVPIIFYGKVEDQFSNLVADATINFDVRIYNGFKSTVKRGQVISDANGLFLITGYQGERLDLTAKKQGYVLVSMNGSGIYSHLWPESQRAHPDPNNPVVITMYKLQGAEPLVNINQHYKFHYTDAPINFDLIANQIVSSGGDIKIKVNRPSGEISERNRRDWGFEIEALDGGIMEAINPGRVYTAPADGYEQSENINASSNRHGIEFIQQSFFVKSRNGQVYSKFDISFGINSGPDDLINVTFKGVANTNGSRNWEATVPQ